MSLPTVQINGEIVAIGDVHEASFACPDSESCDQHATVTVRVPIDTRIGKWKVWLIREVAP